MEKPRQHSGVFAVINLTNRLENGFGNKFDV